MRTLEDSLDSYFEGYGGGGVDRGVSWFQVRVAYWKPWKCGMGHSCVVVERKKGSTKTVICGYFEKPLRCMGSLIRRVYPFPSFAPLR